jgi:hypothetical protein
MDIQGRDAANDTLSGVYIGFSGRNPAAAQILVTKEDYSTGLFNRTTIDTGMISLNGDTEDTPAIPTLPQHVTTKKYVDDSINGGFNTVLQAGTGIDLTYADDTLIISATGVSRSNSPYITGGKISANNFTPSGIGGVYVYSVPLTLPNGVNDYSVTITGQDARAWTVNSISTTGFTIESNSEQPLVGNVYYTLFQIS